MATTIPFVLIDAGDPFISESGITIGNDGDSNGQITLAEMDGVNEGGQINFNPVGAFTDTMFIDRYQNTLRFVLDGTVVGFFNSSGLKFNDSQILQFGTDGDTTVQFNGTGLFFDQLAGNMNFRNLDISGLTTLQNNDSSDVTKTTIQAGGATPGVKLYEDGVEVLGTRADGFTIGGEANAYLTAGSTQTLVVFDGNDYLQFVRVSNNLITIIGGIQRTIVDDSATAGHTSLQVRDVNTGLMKRVEVGAIGSGGAGYKLLRVLN